MRTNRLTAIVCLASTLILASSAWSQIVRIDFRSEVTQVSGMALPGVKAGTIITGRVEVDLSTLPADYDPDPNFGGYGYNGGRPGMTLQFDTGFQHITYDSVNAAGDPGISPGIFVNDEQAGRDYLSFQFRNQNDPYAAILTFELYDEPRTLITGDYFPESVNLEAGLARANLAYFNSFTTDLVMARNVSATMTVDVGDSVTSLLVSRVNTSNLTVPRKRILLSALEAAEAAFAAGNCDAGLRQLEKFQNKVRAQVEKSDPTLAGRLIAGAQSIINSGCGN